MSRRLKIFALIALLVLVGASNIYAQTNMINNGQVIFIPNDALMYVSGNYVDQSGSGKFEAGIRLAGTMELGGDLVNSRKENSFIGNVFSDDGNHGTLRLIGDANQSFRALDLETGSNTNLEGKGATNTTLLRNLEVDKSGGTVYVDTDLQSINSFRLVSSNQANVNLRGGDLRIYEFLVTEVNSDGDLVLSNDTRSAVLEEVSGIVTSSTGRQVLAERSNYQNVARNSLDYNFAGVGLGLQFVDGAALASATVVRSHSNISTVSNGVSVIKSFEIEGAVGIPLPVRALDFYLSEDELNGLNLSDLSVYVTEAGDGVPDRWRKIEDMVVGSYTSPPNNLDFDTNDRAIVTFASSVGTSTDPTLGDQLFSIEGDQPYKIVLAHNTCSPIPTLQLHSVSTDGSAPDRGDFTTGEVFNGCDAEKMTVTVEEDGDVNGYRYWWTGNQADGQWFDEILINDDGTADNVFEIESGTHEFNVIAISREGCPATLGFDYRIRANPPVPTFEYEVSHIGSSSDQTVCTGNTVQFDITSDNPQTGASEDDFEEINVTWDFGDGTTTDEYEPSHVYPDFDYGDIPSNVYQTSLVLTTSYGCFTEDVITPIDVKPRPVFDFAVDGYRADEWFCEHDAIEFPVDITDGIFSNATHDYASTRNLYWTYGDDQVSEATGVTFTTDATADIVQPYEYLIPRNDTQVELVMEFENTRCWSTVTPKPISIKPTPDVSYTPEFLGAMDTEVCVDEVIDFNNSSTLALITGDEETMVYDWDFGDGNTSNERSPSRPYTIDSQPGSIDAGLTDRFRANLTVTSSVYGCAVEAHHDLMIYPKPIGSFSMNNPDICEGFEAVFTNTSDVEVFDNNSGLTFNWDFGDLSGIVTNTNSDLGWEGITHDYVTPGLYTVSLERVSDFGCSNTINFMHEVHANPIASFIADPVCEDESYTIRNTSRVPLNRDLVTGYEWTIETQGLFDTEDVQVSFPTFGDYQVDLTVESEFGCVGSTTGTVTVDRKPSFTLQPIISCDEFITIDPEQDPSRYLPIGTVYEWFDSDGNLLNEGNTGTPQLTGVTLPGVYTVEMSRPDGEYCRSSQNVQVVALSAEVSLSENGSLEFCQEGMLTANVRTEQADITNTYTWFRNGQELTGENGAELTVNQPGTYSVEVVSDYVDDQCTSTDAVEVTIFDPPAVSLDDIELCPETMGELSVNVTGATYEWHLLDDDVVLSTTNSLEVSEEGFYEVIIYRDGCETNAVAEVTVLEPAYVDFVTNAVTFCVGSEIDFVNQSYAREQGASITSLRWTFEDGTNAATSRVTKIFDAAGEYEVQLEVETSNSCTSMITKNVEIQGLPSADFVINDFCKNVSGEFIGNEEAGIENYWEFGDGLRETGVNVSHQYSLAGDYTVSLETVSSSGCRSYNEELLTIHEIPTFNTKGQVVTCASEITLDAGNSGSTYVWRDDETNTIGVNRRIDIDQNGDYSVEITNANACVIEEEFEVVLNTAIEPDLGPNRQVCGELVLDAGYFAGATYAWSTGVNTQTLEVTEAGLYSVDIIDMNGCVGSDEVLIQWLESPDVDLGDDFGICPGQDIQLHARNTGSTFEWSTGETSQRIRVSTPGTYAVEVTNIHGCVSNDEIEITYFEEPEADFDVIESCLGTEMDFIDLSLDRGETLTYNWLFDDGVANSDASPSHQFTTPGQHTASLEVTSPNGCNSAIEKEFKVHPLPSVNFTVESICEGETYELTNLTTIEDGTELSYFWQLPNNEFSNVVSPQVLFDEDGTFPIDLRATSAFGCVSDEQKAMNVNALPDIVLPSEVVTCDPSVVLDAGNVGSTYSWNTLETTQEIEVANSGTYEVLVTTPEGCAADQEVNVEIHNIPALSLGDDFGHCGTATLTANLTNVYYEWSTGENTAQIYVDESGVYSLTVRNDEFCSATDEIEVTINTPPSVELPFRVEMCEEESVDLDAASPSVDTYLWSNGETTSSIVVTEIGDYSVELTSPEGCSATEVVRVVVKDKPEIAIADNVAACDFIVLNPGETGASYTWSNGTTDYFATFTESGLYTIELIGDNECVSTKQFEVAISDSPEITLGEDQEICFGNTTILFAGQEGLYDYLWSDGSELNNLEVGGTGTYVVTATNGEGCSSDASVLVQVRPAIELDLGEDHFVCDSTMLVLDAGIDSVSYSWISNHGETSSDKVFEPEQMGTFSLTVLDDIGCMASDEVTITPTNNTIEASFLSSSFADVGDTVQFALLTDALNASYEWFFGDGTRSEQENPDKIYFREGDFDVTLIASNEACTDTLVKTISIVEGRTEDQPIYQSLFTSIDDMNLYPNPAVSDYLNVYFELSQYENLTLMINDMSGTIIHNQELGLEKETIRFDVSSLSRGVYFLTAATTSQVRRVKFIVN